MDHRQYDPAIGRFDSMDKLAEMKYDNTPYRFAFNNPNFWVDPNGLFETRKEAREYRREHGITGRIVKGDDGTFSINDKKNNISYFKPEAGLNVSTVNSDGIATSVLVTNENNAVSTGKTANDYAGLFATGLEASSGSFRLTNGAYNGNSFSPKFYASSWTGGSRAQIKTFNVSKIGKGLGTAGIAVGTVLDGVGVVNYYDKNIGLDSPNSVHPAKMGTNLGMAAYGYFIHPLPALLYLGIDMFYPEGWAGDGEKPGLARDQERLDQENKAINPNWQLWPGAMKQ